MWSSSLSMDMFLQTTPRPFTFVVALAMISLSLRTYHNSNDPELVTIEQIVGMKRENYRQFLHQGIQAAFRTSRYRELYDVDLIQALLLDIGSTDIGSASKGWTSISLLVYMAQSMGFHRDPNHLGLSMIEGEKRRRLWWLIQIYDIAMSYSQGIPAHIDREETDCQLPRYNIAIDGDSPGYENAVEWFVIFVQITIMFSPLNRAYHARYQSTKEVRKVHDELASLEKKIPKGFRPDHATGSSEIQWRQILLESLMSRALLCHHVSYLHNEKLPQSHRIALEAAKRNMRIFCRMDSLPSTDDMQYRWFGEMWMFSAPLLATVLLATDLVASKSMDEVAWDLVECTEIALRRAPELAWIPNGGVLLDTICALRSERLFGADFFGRIMGADGLETVGWEWMSGYM
ncbi:putative transcriptional regulatory protein [Neolecta irregularis DAH-3]|uniref:Putative transcriptional regulatory protein n=1 Tax=Neolecta irregularis (strain DAH-3) TaxID=1198029 RepID=A0A1U7LN48_NEOID|nr:putative transcriptional regulatory protein [Neolecta irregularis DAH-3]|eukprot:OLL23951.1 putative transcriptional regulatory protein [Neolecta irregularis DAH-3]